MRKKHFLSQNTSSSLSLWNTFWTCSFMMTLNIFLLILGIRSIRWLPAYFFVVVVVQVIIELFWYVLILAPCEPVSFFFFCQQLAYQMPKYKQMFVLSSLKMLGRSPEDHVVITVIRFHQEWKESSFKRIHLFILWKNKPWNQLKLHIFLCLFSFLCVWRRQKFTNL